MTEQTDSWATQSSGKFEFKRTLAREFVVTLATTPSKKRDFQPFWLSRVPRGMRMNNITHCSEYSEYLKEEKGDYCTMWRKRATFIPDVECDYDEFKYVSPLKETTADIKKIIKHLLQFILLNDHSKLYHLDQIR